MGIIWKYAFLLVLALAVIYVYAPLSLEYVVKLRWLDDINVVVTKSLAPAKPEASVSQFVQSPLRMSMRTDYRIAQRIKSNEGWRSFLDAHPDGPHAQSARSEARQTASGREASCADGCPGLEWWIIGHGLRARRPSGRLLHCSKPPSTICKRDEDRLQRLSSPTRDKAMRFLTDYAARSCVQSYSGLRNVWTDRAPSATVAAQSHSSNVAEAGVAGRRRSNVENKTHWRVSSPSFSQDAPAPASNLHHLADPFGAFWRAPRNSTAFSSAGGGPSGGVPTAERPASPAPAGGRSGGGGSAAAASGGGSSGSGSVRRRRISWWRMAASGGGAGQAAARAAGQRRRERRGQRRRHRRGQRRRQRRRQRGGNGGGVMNRVSLR